MHIKCKGYIDDHNAGHSEGRSHKTRYPAISKAVTQPCYVL